MPWHHLAHGNTRNPEQRHCRSDWTESYLELRDAGTERQIRCTRCGANETPAVRRTAAVSVPAPALGSSLGCASLRRESPESPAWLVEINDVRVHSPLTLTALVIPPESRIRRGTVLDRLYGSSRNQRLVRNARTRLARRGVIRRLAGEYRCSDGEIEEAIAEIDKGYPLYGRAITTDDLLVDEYRALIRQIPRAQGRRRLRHRAPTPTPGRCFGARWTRVSLGGPRAPSPARSPSTG